MQQSRRGDAVEWTLTLLRVLECGGEAEEAGVRCVCACEGEQRGAKSWTGKGSGLRRCSAREKVQQEERVQWKGAARGKGAERGKKKRSNVPGVLPFLAVPRVLSWKSAEERWGIPSHRTDVLL